MKRFVGNYMEFKVCPEMIREPVLGCKDTGDVVCVLDLVK